MGSIRALVELDADQMNGETESRDGGFPNRAPRASDVTLMSVTSEMSCQPTWLPEDVGDWTDVVSLTLKSRVFMCTDAATLDELYIVMLSLISQKDAEKL